MIRAMSYKNYGENMSEELLQRGLDRKTPTSKIGRWDYYNIGATTLKALKAANIIRNVDYGSVENKKLDAIIVNKKDVIAVIEFKQPKEFKTKEQKQKAINQEIEVARKLDCKLIIATDTKDTVWVNALTGEKIIDENGNIITANFSEKDEKIASLIEKINWSINEKNNQILQPELVDPTKLARSIWQDIWSVSGATPENCLYTFVELFIFKYLSDLGILKNTNSFDSLIAMYKTDTADEVLQYYADIIRKRIKGLFPESEIDKTTIINGTIFVSKDQTAVSGYSTVFKKVLERFQDYGRLEHIDYDFKSKLFESFLKESISKKNWGQFFTPMKVIRAIEKIARDEIKEGAVICDPACGVGKFLLEPIKSRLDRFYKVEGDKVIPKITIRGFDKGFDKDEQKTIILAKANMLIYFSEIIKNYPSHTKEFAKIFNDSFTLKTNSILGTLREPTENTYDLILTNPPYVTSGSSNLKEEIQKDSELKNYYKINAIGVEGLFMEWIVRALKPNGKAFIVVPDGIFNRQNDKNLRSFLRQECYIDGIISLPLNTFFTTNKKTYILCITKKNNKADVQTDPVFTYIVSEIGETRDIYRFDIEQNDLDEAAKSYNSFKGSSDYFIQNNKDPRCKIFPIEQFTPEANWSVDRWWNREENIALGIEEEDKAIKLEEFPYFLENIADSIMSFKNIILDLNEKKKSDLKFKEVLVGDVFEFPSIKGITKEFIERNKGVLPVYGGKQFEEPVGCVSDELKDIKIFENCLAWNRNGTAGYVFFHDHKFTTTDDHRPLSVKQCYSKSVNLHYFRYVIEQELLTRFSWGDKAGKDKVKQIVLKIPILPNGEFDLEAQNKIVERYNMVADVKAKAQEYERKLKELTVNFNNEDVAIKEVSISDIFDVKKGLAKYTNAYIHSIKDGMYDLYSSQTKDNGVIGKIDTYDYDCECLTWTTDGIYAGTVFYRNGKFSMTTHCGALIPKNLPNLSIRYLEYFLGQTLKKYAHGEGNKRVTVDIVKKIKISIPILPNGDFDLEAQVAIAEKHNKIAEIKNLLALELKKIIDITVQ